MFLHYVCLPYGAKDLLPIIGEHKESTGLYKEKTPLLEDMQMRRPLWIKWPMETVGALSSTGNAAYKLNV